MARRRDGYRAMTRRHRPKPPMRAIRGPSDQAIPPTPEWLQHHDAEQADDPQAGIKARGWRRASKPLQLYAAARIDRTGLDACRQYLDDYEIGIAGAVVANGGSGGGVERDARLDAATRYRRAVQAVGDVAAAVLDTAVVRDASWSVTARVLGRKGGNAVEAAKRAACLAIEALAEHYFGRRAGGE